MTKDDIIRMAREAKLSNDFGNLGYPYLPELEHFANLVAAAERESCAVIAFNAKTYLDAAEAIRARGQG
jgi:hypothetical protein